MSVPGDESHDSKVAKLTARVDSLTFGVKTAWLAVLMLFSLFNVSDTFAISYFRVIFLDALANRPLPAITRFFLDHQVLVTLGALLWPVLGLAAIFVFRRVSSTMIAISFLLVPVFVQLALNWVALFMPLIALTDSIQ